MKVVCLLGNLLLSLWWTLHQGLGESTGDEGYPSPAPSTAQASKEVKMNLSFKVASEVPCYLVPVASHTPPCVIIPKLQKVNESSRIFVPSKNVTSCIVLPGKGSANSCFLIRAKTTEEPRMEPTTRDSSPNGQPYSPLDSKAFIGDFIRCLMGEQNSGETALNPVSLLKKLYNCCRGTPCGSSCLEQDCLKIIDTGYSPPTPIRLVWEESEGPSEVVLVLRNIERPQVEEGLLWSLWSGLRAAFGPKRRLAANARSMTAKRLPPAFDVSILQPASLTSTVPKREQQPIDIDFLWPNKTTMVPDPQETDPKHIFDFNRWVTILKDVCSGSAKAEELYKEKVNEWEEEVKKEENRTGETWGGGGPAGSWAEEGLVMGSKKDGGDEGGTAGARSPPARPPSATPSIDVNVLWGGPTPAAEPRDRPQLLLSPPPPDPLLLPTASPDSLLDHDPLTRSSSNLWLHLLADTRSHALGQRLIGHIKKALQASPAP